MADKVTYSGYKIDKEGIPKSQDKLMLFSMLLV